MKRKITKKGEEVELKHTARSISLIQKELGKNFEDLGASMEVPDPTDKSKTVLSKGYSIDEEAVFIRHGFSPSLSLDEAFEMIDENGGDLYVEVVRSVSEAYLSIYKLSQAAQPDPNEQAPESTGADSKL